MFKAPWVCRSCSRRLRFLQRPIFIRARSASNNTPLRSQDDNPTVSPALLTRARASFDEHHRLNDRISESFDTNAAKRIGELAPIASAYSQYTSASSTLDELHTLLSDPNTDTELRDLASEDIATARAALITASLSLTTALVPVHPFAHLPCLVEIRPGIGGSEAALFAADLLRMYTAYCGTHELRARLLKYEDADGISDPNGSDAPLQEAVLEVQAAGSYGRLRGEAGVHRVQRVPATESKGRTHTSAANVMVLPSVAEEGGAADVDVDDPSSDYYVSSADVRTDVMRSSGAGGQHVNKTESAVRLTHAPSGIVVSVSDSRSQLQNRAKAWQILRGKLAQQRREAREEEILALRRGVSGAGKTGRSDKVRTYNWGQQRVTDHRSGASTNQLDEVLDGGDALEEIMESVRGWFVEQEILGMVAEAEAKEKEQEKNKKSSN